METILFIGLEEDGNKDVIEDGLVLSFPDIQKRFEHNIFYSHKSI